MSFGKSAVRVVTGSMSAGLASIASTGAFALATPSAMRCFCSSVSLTGIAMVGSTSSSWLYLENFAGTVWLSCGAPGTLSLPSTKTAVSAAVDKCALGSSLPPCPGTVCSI